MSFLSIWGQVFATVALIALTIITVGTFIAAIISLCTSICRVIEGERGEAKKEAGMFLILFLISFGASFLLYLLVGAMDTR